MALTLRPSTVPRYTVLTASRSDIWPASPTSPGKSGVASGPSSASGSTVGSSASSAVPSIKSAGELVSGLASSLTIQLGFVSVSLKTVLSSGLVPGWFRFPPVVGSEFRTSESAGELHCRRAGGVVISVESLSLMVRVVALVVADVWRVLGGPTFAPNLFCFLAPAPLRLE